MMRSEEGIDIDRDVNIHLENRKESRFFFLFIWILYAVVYMSKNCYNAAIADIVEEGILTKSQTGLITSVFFLIYAPLQVVGGKASDRKSPERLIKIGLWGSALANLVVFFNQSYCVMLGAWIFNAVVQFGLWPSVFKIISTQLVRSDCSVMIFYISFTNSIGLLLSYLVAAVLPEWELNFAVSAVMLIILAIGLHIYCKHLNPLMKWDRRTAPKAIEKPGEGIQKKSGNVFSDSGFYMMIIVTFLSTIVMQAAKTLAPVMLLESYAMVPAYLGNLLNLIVIVAGIAGMMIIKLFLYPKYIQNEAVGIFLMLLMIIPCTVLLYMVGTITISQTVLGLCGISMFSTATELLTSYYNAQFVKWGKVVKRQESQMRHLLWGLSLRVMGYCVLLRFLIGKRCRYFGVY